MRKNIILLILIITFTRCLDPKTANEKAVEFLTAAFWILCPALDPDSKTPLCARLRPPKGSETLNCKVCPEGYSLGSPSSRSNSYFEINDSSVTIIPSCSWTSKSPSTECGLSAGNNTCKMKDCKEREKAASALAFGYDLTASDPPVGVKSITPPSPAIIYENQNFNIQFDGSVKSDSISFSESLKSELNPNFRFGRTLDYNDTLPLAASTNWSLGAFKSLNINLLDMNDKPIIVPLVYHVIKVGTSKTPSFNTCDGGCKPGWQNAYSIQFNATGGVPPYKWFASADAPPEANVPSGSLPPGATMNQAGVLSGPATNNFMPDAVYGFGVVVVDAVGQMDVKVITIDTTDAAAQYAACVLAGLCG